MSVSLEPQSGNADRIRSLLQCLVCVLACWMSSNALADEPAATNERQGRIVFETSVIENAPPGTLIESLRNRFPELTHFRLLAERRPLPFQLTDDGELTVARGEPLNFEERRLWVLTAKARAPRTEDRYLDDFMQSLADASGNSNALELERLQYQDLVLSIRVHLIDQEESPRVSDRSITINPNSNLKKLGRIVPSEIDLDDPLTFSLTCSTSDLFDVDGRTGIVSVVRPDQFDWTQNRQAIEVEVTDSHGNSARSVIEFNVTPPTVEPTQAPTQLADGSMPANDPSITGETTTAIAKQNDKQQDRDAISLPAVEQPIAPNPKLARSQTTPRREQDSNKTNDRKLSRNSYDSGSGRSGKRPAEKPGVDVGKNSVESTTTDDAESGSNLNKAARTINSTAGSSTALNEVTADRARSKEGSKPSLSGPRPTSDATTNASQQPLPRANVRPFQLLLLVLSLAAGGFIVYRKYKKARQERLEAVKQATSDSEARLDMYMNAQNRSDEESVSEETPPAENSEPAKSIVKALEPDADLDPDAPFDPESLIDEAMLAEAPHQSSEFVVAARYEDSSNQDSLVQEASTDILLPSTPAPTSPLVLLDESLLADEILAPRSAERDQLEIEALQRQLDKINEKFDALNIESDASLANTAELSLEDDTNSVDSAQLQASTSDDIASNDGEESQVTSVADRVEPEAEHVLEANGALQEATYDSSITNEVFEPAYELQWDPEIQRYVKVEKSAAVDAMNDDGNSLASRHLSDDFANSTAPSSGDDSFATAFDDSSTAVACMDDATETDDQPSERVMSLRAELADLFNLHVATTTQNRASVHEPAAADDQQQDAAIVEEKSPEESHLDSVAKYLSQLLERSRKEENADIFVERRGGSSGKWDGVDRRQKPKPVVKSYIESYLEQHGGQLQEDIQELSQRTQELAAAEEPRPVRERKPIDVTMLRKNMESFRAVAERSVESAMAAYKVRQAKGRLVGRSMLITGLVIIVGLGIGTNVFRTFHLEPLNWLMCAFILLCVAEFFLRVESIRKHRREMRLRILSAQKPTQKLVEVEAPAVEIVETEPLPGVISASE